MIALLNLTPESAPAAIFPDTALKGPVRGKLDWLRENPYARDSSATPILISRMRLFILSSIVTLGLAACGNSADIEPLRFADGFLVQSILTVDESPAAINVMPVVRPDPFGGYLVADISEAQIRRYGDDGDLRAFFGRRGDGPGEFQNPGIAVRIPSGQIAVLDRNMRLTVLDSSATDVVSARNLPLQHINDADILNDLSCPLISGTLDSV